jgi:hypothetical protein
MSIVLGIGLLTSRFISHYYYYYYCYYLFFFRV